MDSVLSVSDQFWITFLAAGVLAGIPEYLRFRKSRRAMEAELDLLLGHQGAYEEQPRPRLHRDLSRMFGRHSSGPGPGRASAL